MRKQFIIILAVAMMLALGGTPVFALLNSTDDHSVSGQQGQLQGQIAEGGDANAQNNANNGQQQGIADSGNANQGQAQGQIGINKNDNKNLQGQQQGIDSDIESKNTNTNLLGNDQDQKQGQGQGQGQAQGQGQQSKQGQGQAQGNANKIDINDNSEYNAYSFAPPAIHAQKGTSSANMYSIFGGVGLSQTEEYTIAIEKLGVIERLEGLGYITKEEAIAEARETFEELDSASQPKRVLGIFGRTRGRHLLNGLGLFAFDSFYKEGQKPFSKSGAWSKKGKEKARAELVEDTLDSYTGNEGNL